MLDIKDLPKFKTSDGREIVLLPGWFENKVKIGWPYGIKDFETFVNTCILTEKSYPDSVEFCFNKLITADAMKSLIEESGYEFRGSERLLDLCTGPAVLPRVFKALGLCKEAYGVDVEDRSRAYSDDRLMSIWRNNRDSTYHEDHKYGLDVFQLYETVNRIQTGINNCFYMLFCVDDTNKDCSMDGYDVSDLLSYAPKKTFDVITMMFGMDYFDIDEFFQKVSSLLNVGGVFATVNDYCYDSFACAMHLPMDAPWLHVRVTRDDLFRYYDEFRPDIAEAARKAVYFPSIHITVKDYVRAAKENGLEICFYRRIIGTNYVRNVLFSDPFLRNYFRDIVLPDSRAINRSVVADDFFTSHLAMVFRKVG